MGCKLNKLEPPAAETPQKKISGINFFLLLHDNVLYGQYGTAKPDGTVVAVAKLTQNVSPGVLYLPPKHLAYANDTTQIYKGAISWIIECAKYFPTISMYKNDTADYSLPFIFILHDRGNEIIASGLRKCTPETGEMYIESCDAIAAVSPESEQFNDQIQSLDNFIKNVKQSGGRYTKLDESGGVPPV